ncbi:MAG TPA: phenylalanine--tRNA ligase subunit beta [Candidatus Gracilibacteria bacterium]|nr:phenylalanine--tRNA ligase subunit beta [Candidatus Gracilibacteria bacterium]
MKISLNWLRDFVDIPNNIDAKEFGRIFTVRTAEIEHVEDQGKLFSKMVIGKIKTIKPHPDADKLRITETDVGNETLQIVCGAPNIKEGMLVPVALVGSRVRWHGEGELVTLEKAKIRGIESSGMICAGEEIGLDPSPEGIVDLSPLNVKPGTPLAEALGKNDTILTLDNKSITHRPDLWGHYGLAREVAAITGKKLNRLPENTKLLAGNRGAGELSIEVKEKKLCPRYVGIIMEGITVGPSPEWIRQRLNNVGYRSINNIVDATNYVMAELGQPLHAFDADKIEGGIVVRSAQQGEEIATLDGNKRKLSKGMLVIADHKKAVAIAGVMGGANSEVDSSTSRILLESANFNPSSVRKTSVRLNLRSEAVQRFEKSLDPHLCEQALDRVCEIILQICPTAKIMNQKKDVKNFADKKMTVKVKLKRVQSKIGAEIPASKAIEFLNALEFKASEKTKGTLEVEIPSFRATKDISIEDDLTEEIARMYGYENIAPRLPELPIKLPLENSERKLKHFARQILSYGLGMNEVYNYSFYSQKDINKCLLPAELHIQVNNYLSEDQTHLRVSLMPNLLKNVAHNLKYSPEFRLYEVGRTYEDLQEYFPLEQKKICGVVVKDKKTKDVFYEAKGLLETFLGAFQTAGIEMKKGESLCPYAHPNKYAGYYLKKDGSELARVFEVHPLVAKNYDLENVKIAAFEINFSLLASLGQRETKYKSLPKFPGIDFDISVLVDDTIEIGGIEKALRESDRKLVKKVELFDLYRGANVPEGKKSLAFRIGLRADDRTLTDAEMKEVQEKIFGELAKMGGEIRGLK